MKNLKTEFVTIYRLGYLLADVPADIMESLRLETEEMQKSNFANCIPNNMYLAGNIEREYTIVKSIPKLEEYLPQLAAAYFDAYGGAAGRRFKLREHQTISTLKEVWVNFQKKHEFNPPHVHGGSLSYVIYVKLPYLQQDEANNPNSRNSNTKLSGMFNFLYVDQYVSGGLGQHNIVADRNFEGKIIVFASTLFHTVYPFFTSDEYRVTVAGNIEIY
jgi:hypothetical protein